MRILVGSHKGKLLKAVNIENNTSLSFIETSLPEISNDECLVKVLAIGVNRADLLQRQGKYPPPKGASPILGLEMSGVIVSMGGEVKNYQVNQRVFGLLSGGAYAEYVVIKAAHLFNLPTHFSFVQGAAIAETFLTAYQCLFLIGHLQPNSKVLIHAGASGVGSAAIQLAKQLNCHVTITTSNSTKIDACLSLGADEAINYLEEDFVNWSKQHKPEGFDFILDVVGADYLARNIKVAAPDAHIVILSILGGRYGDKVDIASILSKRLTITGTTLRNRSDLYKTELVTAFKADFNQALIEEKIYPVIDTVFNWEQVEESHQKLATNQTIGKIVLSID